MEKWIHRNLSDNHCLECLMLDGCWFIKEKIPKWPHHQFCHCVLEDIPYSDILDLSSCKCPYEKFDPYLFDPDNFYKHGKSAMLESWGYSILDSTYLKEEIEKQGLEKYKNGDYALGLLNEYGQRISIWVAAKKRKWNDIIYHRLDGKTQRTYSIKYTIWREIKMKYLDCVEVIVEKEKYTKHGVHKGMQGVIWLEESINGTWDVFFDLWGEHAPIGDIAVKEEDLKLIPKTDTKVNERIKAEFGD